MTGFVVYNPWSANGHTGRNWQEIQGALESIFPLLEAAPARTPGEAARLVRDALRNGHLEIVAVGDDGVINEAVNGFFDHGVLVSPDAVFSFVCTGGALCRHFGIEPDAGIVRLKRSRIRKLDVGRVACLSPTGEPVARYFIGSAGFGFTGRLARRLGRARIARFFGGGFARAWHGFLALLAWRGCRVRLLAPASAENAGGYDEIAGISSVQLSCGDGLFDVTVAQGGSRVRLWQQIWNGPDGRSLRAARLTAAPTVETVGRVDVETDGESAGVLPATFEICPGLLNVRL